MEKILYSITFFILLAITPFANAYYPQQRTNPNDPAKHIQTALDKLEEFNENANTANPILLKKNRERVNLTKKSEKGWV